MPGIFGVIDPTAPPEARQALLGRMAASLRHRPDYALTTFAGGPATLGCLSLGLSTDPVEPFFNHERTRALLFAGELYETDHAASNAVLAMIEQHGEAGLARLHGVFACALWDLRERRLLLINDRFGLWPIYYAVQHGRLLFAPEVKGILADSEFRRCVNDGAVINLLHFGHVLGDETLFADVTLLPPGSVLEWRDGHVNVRAYWDIQLPEINRAQSEAEVVERAAALTQQAVQRRLSGPQPNRVGFLLSGGLDTRTLIAATHRSGAHQPTFVFGTPNGDDVRAAGKIAQVIGSPHRFIELTPDFLQQHAAHGVWLTDGMMIATVMSVLSPLPQVRREIDFVLSGDCGDWIMGGGTPLGPQYTGLSDEAASELRYQQYYDTGGFPEATHAELFAPDFFRRVGGRSREAYREHNRNAPVRDAHNRLVYFALRHEALRTSGYGIALLRGHMLPRLPFYDHDLFDFVLSAPLEYRRKRRLQLEVIRRLSPTLMNVVWQYTGQPANAGRLRTFIGLASHRLHQKASRLTHHFIPWPYDREITPMEYWLRTGLRPWLEQLLLNPHSLNRGYFRPEAIRRVVAEHVEGYCDRTYQLGLLITFELWLRQFVEGERT